MASTVLDRQVGPIRNALRRLVQELDFLGDTLAGTNLQPSAVHALVEIGARGSVQASELCDVLALEKSSVSRMVRKLVASGDVEEGTSERDGRAKPLSLTPKGRRTLAEIDGFARRQVTGALERLPSMMRPIVRDGLFCYADALAADRAGRPYGTAPTADIQVGYRPGVIGRCAEMHARHYERTAGFGRSFEAQVAAGLAEFANRLDNPCNELWLAVQAGVTVGTIAIDGEDMGSGVAHLRWFIVNDALRGSGIGRRLMTEAMRFVDAQRFRETYLWTFKGLDSARHLYESFGFALTSESAGTHWGTEVVEQRFSRPGPSGG